MLNKVGLALALLVTACVTNPTEESPRPADPWTMDELRDHTAGLQLATPREVLEVEDWLLTLYQDDGVCPIAEAEGPCAAACDPDALAAYVPAGTCVTFVCHTSDGSVARVGGCNADEPLEGTDGAQRPELAN